MTDQTPTPPPPPPPGPTPERLAKVVTAADAQTAAARLSRGSAQARKAQAQAALAELRLSHAHAKEAAEKSGRPVPLPASVACLPGEAVEKCRQALQVFVRSGKPCTSGAALRKAAKVDQEVAAAVWTVFQAGLMPSVEAPWAAGAATTGRVLPTGKKREELMRRLRTCKTARDAASVSAEVGALIASGEIDGASARSLLDACKETRVGLEAAAKRADATAEPDDRRMALVSQEALELAKAFDHLGDDRREMVAGFVATMIEQENEEAKGRMA